MASDEVPIWLRGVRGVEVLPLITDDHSVIRVEAPPGAGKTYGLKRRVVRLLHPEGEALDPSDVVILAFNRVIAQDLKQEISEELENTGVDPNELRISTIHSLCSRILDEDGGRLLLPHEREMMLYDVLCRRPDLRESFGSFQKAQQALHNHEAGLVDHRHLWMECQRWMSEHEARSISDVPDELLKRLEMGDYADERYRHVFVDEFQDLTTSEQKLAAKLRTDDGSLLALGDPQQSIYLFRGNARDGLDSLGELTGQVPYRIDMGACQRCPHEVVDAANALMATSGRTIQCESEEEANIHLVQWKSLEAEATGLAKAIEENWRQNPDPRQKHLCMVTRRAFGYRLRDRLRKLNPELKVHLAFSENILEEWPVREAFLWFSLMAAPDPATYRAWLGYKQPDAKGAVKPPDRNAGAYLSLLEEGQVDESALRSLASESREKRRGQGGVHLWDRARQFVAIRASLDWSSMSAADLIEACFGNDSKLRLGSVPNETAQNDLDLLRTYATTALGEIRDGLEGEASEGELRVRIADELRYRIATREPLDDAGPTDILITTLWGAKGLTAHHTYLIGVCDQAIPGRRPESYPGSNHEYLEEQRRLFFVSLTRTKRTLVLSMPKSVANGQARQLNLHNAGRYGDNRRQLTASRFLTQIRRSIDTDTVDGEQWSGC